MTLRGEFVSTVASIVDQFSDTVLLLGDISVHAFRDTFKRHPGRCYNIGICEQASVSIAAGLAHAGLYPIFHTIDSFMVRRAYEQIRLDFGEQCLPGLFISVGGSADYAKLGATHMCAEGPAMMGLVPGMKIILPQSQPEVCAAIWRSYLNHELAYIRLEEGHAIETKRAA